MKQILREICEASLKTDEKQTKTEKQKSPSCQDKKTPHPAGTPLKGGNCKMPDLSIIKNNIIKDWSTKQGCCNR
ncbi:hypothetical protein DU508_14500 [Pedobacter chinensis]|uniref:Uncharacterized protein n=1 Tax=Pedobacter chinensis TaxID=2282421 RepID=A0A369PW89_9SPHI|nr:hypothetical protein DU508_14500 [Pedobacter chinensis]